MVAGPCLCTELEINQLNINVEQIIDPISVEVLKGELTEDKRLRFTNKSHNEIYVVTWQDSPQVVREIGRLREIAFRYGTPRLRRFWEGTATSWVLTCRSMPRGNPSWPPRTCSISLSVS